MKIGWSLSSEEHGPARLVELAGLAEQHGLDFVSISDHFHPWIAEQGHSPFVWSVLGAMAERTESIGVAVGVTCPTVRIHPAIIAQASATVSLLLDGRFVLGVGSGEALNEHVLGDRWPPAPQRIEMLEEAVEVVRRLWTGDSVTHRGRHYVVENARIFDAPEHPPLIVMSAFGPIAAGAAARCADGLWTHADSSGLVSAFEEAGGSGPRYGQVTFCWARDRDEAIATALRVWPNSSLPGQLSQDLPTPRHFEEASQIVTGEMLVESTPCGPDLDPIVDAVRTARDAGIDHVYLHQLGSDQESCFELWDGELGERLRAVAAGE